MTPNSRSYLNHFSQPDSIVPTSTQGTQAWDRYAYSNNNPIRYTDPSGHVATQGDGGGPNTCSDPLYCENGKPASPVLVKLRKIFNDMADESDIAFNYPVDGCWARAHLMLNRIIERYDGVSVNKVWAFGNFQVNTNGPYGIIYWENHVAPIVTVTGNKDSLTMVIDPSIANGPVSKNGWWSIMTDETPDFLSMQVTSPGEPPVDPLTKQPYSGSGYWLGEDPTTHGGLDGFSIWMMGNYLNCAASGRTYPC